MSEQDEDLEQELLSRAIAAIRERLSAAAENRSQADADDSWALDIPAGCRLDLLQRCFSLSPFELAVLLLAVARELSPGFDRLCAPLCLDPTRAWPSFGLAVAVFPNAHWDAASPDAPLRRARLIELGPGEVLTERSLCVTEPVLHMLMGVRSRDPRLARRLLPLRDHAGPATRGYAEAEAVVHAWRRGQLVCLTAAERDDARIVAATAAAQLGLEAELLDARSLPGDPAERELLLQVLERDIGLHPFAIILELPPLADGPTSHAFVSALESITAPALSISAEAPQLVSRTPLHLPIERSTFAERVASWQRALGQQHQLGADGPSHDLAVHRLAAQFVISDRHIRAAVETTVARQSEHGDTLPAEQLWQTCRVLARPRMADLAQPIQLRASFDNLVLPDHLNRVLQAITAQVRERAQVQHAWGFAERDSRGHGVSAVFAGPSGTGKTMAAEALANALELDLYRIDLSAVVSKYIGETEENLRHVFDAAEAGGALLLFDEADALFGKRTDVRDSHDRHANIEVSYLLQRMEEYRGAALLTTNQRGALDEAFLRRVRFILEFPFPDAALRQRIWQRMIPPEVPTEGLAYDKLARLSVSGGNIRSIVLNAAYLAAAAGGPMTMTTLLEAVRLEYAKVGKSLPPADIRGWSD